MRNKDSESEKPAEDETIKGNFWGKEYGAIMEKKDEYGTV